MWFDIGAFPLRDYCGTVDGAYEIVRRHQPPDDDHDPANDEIAPVIAAALDASGALLALGRAAAIAQAAPSVVALLLALGPRIRI